LSEALRWKELLPAGRVAQILGDYSLFAVAVGQNPFDYILLADDDLSDLVTNALELECSKFENGIRLHEIILPHLAMGSVIELQSWPVHSKELSLRAGSPKDALFDPNCLAA
jgi:hypothetical protein